MMTCFQLTAPDTRRVGLPRPGANGDAGFSIVLTPTHVFIGGNFDVVHDPGNPSNFYLRKGIVAIELNGDLDQDWAEQLLSSPYNPDEGVFALWIDLHVADLIWIGGEYAGVAASMGNDYGAYSTLPP
jgi:hypothetical protein